MKTTLRYQSSKCPGAWKIWPNPVWYPEEGHEFSLEIVYGPGVHQPIISIKGLVVDSSGCLYGIHTMSRPKEVSYGLEGRVKVGGKSYRAYTFYLMVQRPDRSLVRVGAIELGDVKIELPTLRPHENWAPPTPEELATWADDAAATGNHKKLNKRAEALEGFPGETLARQALMDRAIAIEARLDGKITVAVRYEKLSELMIEQYRALPQPHFVETPT